MKRLIHLFVLVILFSTTRSQILSLSVSQLNFGTKQTNLKDSLSFRIRNAGNYPITVSDINTFKAAFTLRDTTFTVRAHDSVTAWVYFKTNQKVTWTDILVVENSGGRGSLTLRLTGTGSYNDPAYASTQNLWENALKAALTNLVTGHTSLGYNTARDRMFETIDDGGVDTIECVYIGRKIYATTRTIAQNQNFNTEHTWPQSFFADEPMVSDLNHLFPSDAVPNSNRANYPFGPVVSNITYNVGGSRLGHRADGATAFEPRDVHKGDVARALFYFMIRYGNLGSYMDAIQENDLRVWNKTDPVSAKEIARNNAIASYQLKRNPLIDHPEFTDRITQYYTTAAPTLYPDIAASPASASLGSISYTDSITYNLTVVNRGRATLNISSVTLQNGTTGYSILSYPSTIPVDSFGTVRVKFKPTLPVVNFYNNTVVINSNDPDQPTLNVPMTATAFLPQVIVRVLLEGPYNPATGLMTTMLRSGGILAARYPGVPIPSNAVDSVNIELRDSLSASYSTTRSFRPCWLLADGNIRGFTDTTGSPKFDDVPAGGYYIVIRHTNHLAIMGSQQYSLSSIPSSAYDFTNSQSNAYGTDATKQVAPSVYAMYAGDANQSGSVNSADLTAVLSQLNAVGYSVRDANLSGIISVADENLVISNLNRASQVP